MRNRIRRKRLIRRMIIMAAVIALVLFGVYQQKYVPNSPVVTASPEVTPTASTTSRPSATPKPTASAKPTETPHVHTWKETHEDVHHEAVGHYETVVLQAAWDEPVKGIGYICGSCGASFGDSGSAAGHISTSHGSEGGYYQSEVTVRTIHHDAITEQRWVMDASAKDETIVTG